MVLELEREFRKPESCNLAIFEAHHVVVRTQATGMDIHSYTTMEFHSRSLVHAGSPDLIDSSICSTAVQLFILQARTSIEVTTRMTSSDSMARRSKLLLEVWNSVSPWILWDPETDEDCLIWPIP